MIENEFRRPSLFAVLVFVVLTILELKKSLKTADNEEKYYLLPNLKMTV